MGILSLHPLYVIIIIMRRGGVGVGLGTVGSSKRKRGGDCGNAVTTISRGKKKDGNVLEMFKKTKTKSMLLLEKTKSSKIIIINDKENNEDDEVIVLDNSDEDDDSPDDVRENRRRKSLRVQTSQQQKQRQKEEEEEEEEDIALTSDEEIEDETTKDKKDTMRREPVPYEEVSSGSDIESPETLRRKRQKKSQH